MLIDRNAMEMMQIPRSANKEQQSDIVIMPNRVSHLAGFSMCGTVQMPYALRITLAGAQLNRRPTPNIATFDSPDQNIKLID